MASRPRSRITGGSRLVCIGCSPRWKVAGSWLGPDPAHGPDRAVKDVETERNRDAGCHRARPHVRLDPRLEQSARLSDTRRLAARDQVALQPRDARGPPPG